VAAASFATGSYPDAVAVADLTGDGVSDLVTANYSGNSVSVLMGNGDGSFQAHQDYATGTSPYAVAAVDVPGAGVPDLVTANEGADTVSILHNRGDGTPSPHVPARQRRLTASAFAAVSVARPAVPTDPPRAAPQAKAAAVVSATFSPVAEEMPRAWTPGRAVPLSVLRPHHRPDDPLADDRGPLEA
jgi:hypothetical protein